MAEFLGIAIILMLVALFFQRDKGAVNSSISRRRKRPSHPKPDIKTGVIK